MKEPVLVVMAAGMGSRYGGLKQIDPVDQEGHIIMDFSIYDAVRAGFKKVIFIIKKENELDQEIQHNLQKCERHPVVFRLYRMNKKQGQGRDSMAMRGFEEIAEIVQENGESYLELKLKEMVAHSRVSGEMMAGKLKTLKYEHNEVLEEAKIENNIVKIPMEACRIHRWTGIGTMGIVPVTVTCSVGPMHMPESTALLYFWV